MHGPEIPACAAFFLRCPPGSGIIKRMAELKGTIAELRFRNEENGYTIATVETDLQPFTVVGVFPPVAEGSFVSCEGAFVTHPKFGRQFKAETVRLVRPDTVYGMIQFLGSGLVRGIGPKRAAAIVSRFGTDTFDVIENHPERLTKVQGISNRMAKEIASSYGEIKTAAEAMSFLMEYGLGAALATKIFNEYGPDTIATVSSNPYRLIEDVRGVGFVTADRMASALGIDPKSDFRVRAGLVYTLNENAEKNGNTLLPLAALAEETSSLLNLDDEELIKKNIADMLISRKLREVEYEGERAVMTAPLYNAEYSSAVKLCRMLESANRALPDCSGEIDAFERSEGVTFHAEQRGAIVSALANGVSVITGGPGTGKTTIVRCLLRILKNHGFTAKLMAPTGRAAKRLSESTGDDASTIHRALMTDGEEEGRGLHADAIIVDEFSMVDVQLLSDLLGELRDDAKLVIVGDADQLPSVGAGNALADIINCGVIPVAKLTRIYRQSERGSIIVNAHRINAGEMPDLGNGGGDFFFIRSETAADSAKLTVDLVTRRLPGYLGCTPEKLQVLCPMKSGEAGCNNLNRLLRGALIGRPEKEVTVGDSSFAPGDKVMHTVNNYNLEWRRGGASGTGVFNGDSGIVAEVRPDSGEIIVEYDDGRLVIYSGEDRSQLMLAYAITVHKSQGSEYEGVVIPVSGGAPLIMTRNLLYTAVTRAKNLAVIVGTEENVARMVKNNYIRRRYSMLRAMIEDVSRKMSLLYGE